MFKKPSYEELEKRVWELEKEAEKRRQVEEELRNSEEKIEVSLKEKNLLLKEIHHRVKNNMQVITSLLKLQSAKIKDKRYAQMFRESQDRIKSMALIHEQLYQSEDLAHIEFRGYVKALTSRLIRSQGVNTDRIKLKIEIDDVEMGLENAIPCGLIINELVSNSLKYAFPGDRNGEIIISLHLTKDDELELVVSDDGVGLPGKIDIRNADSLGLYLVNLLAGDQLGGELKLDRNCGSQFSIKFNKG